MRRTGGDDQNRTKNSKPDLLDALRPMRLPLSERPTYLSARLLDRASLIADSDIDDAGSTAASR